MEKKYWKTTSKWVSLIGRSNKLIKNRIKYIFSMLFEVSTIGTYYFVMNKIMSFLKQSLGRGINHLQKELR